MDSRIIRKAGGAFALLLVCSAWRPLSASTTGALTSTAHWPVKRHRRGPAVVPESPVRPEVRPAPDPGDPPRGALAVPLLAAPLGVPAALWLYRAEFDGRPVYLSAFLHRETHSSLSPPQR